MTSATTRPEILGIRGVHLSFDAHRVLIGVDLRVRACETVSILGGSGAGKSTLLRLIAGLIKPAAGQILVFGEDSVPLSERQLLPLRRRMGFVFQGAALFDSSTVFQNVAFPLEVHTRASEGEIRDRVAEVLERVGLPGIEGHYPAELSGGMRKRVGIARALVLRPELLLFDEPTTGLDPNNARMICDLILDLKRDLCETSVVVTHDLHCAFAVSDEVALLDDGEIVELAPPDEFRQSPRAEVQRFLEGTDSPLTNGRAGWNRVMA